MEIIKLEVSAMKANLNDIIEDMTKTMKPLDFKNPKAKIKSEKNRYESYMQINQIPTLMSFTSYAVDEISAFINASNSIKSSSKKFSNNLPSNKTYEYKCTFINDLIKRPSKQNYPTYIDERYKRANDNLNILNEEFYKIIKSNKTNTIQEKTKLIELILTIKLENQVKIILDEQSKIRDVKKAQKIYPLYLSLLNKDTIKGMAVDLNNFFNALSEIITPNTSKSHTKEAKKYTNDTSQKEINNSSVEINYEYLKEIDDDINKGIYRRNRNDLNKTTIANVSFTIENKKYNFNLFDGNKSQGFTHILNNHYAPQVTKRKKIIKKSIGITIENRMSGSKNIFPVEMNVIDIVEVMTKALSQKTCNVHSLKNKLAGNCDNIIIDTEFPKEISGIKSVKIAAYFNETTNTYTIISFFPTTGSRVRNLILKAKD